VKRFRVSDRWSIVEVSYQTTAGENFTFRLHRTCRNIVQFVLEKFWGGGGGRTRMRKESRFVGRLCSDSSAREITRICDGVEFVC
jgi:hypothetical protein